jgi:hypothetical protein
MRVVSRAARVASIASLLGCTGCMMPGMTYKMPMPSCVTFKTQKPDQASFASSQTRGGRVTPVVQRAAEMPVDLQ